MKYKIQLLNYDDEGEEVISENGQVCEGSTVVTIIDGEAEIDEEDEAAIALVERLGGEPVKEKVAKKAAKKAEVESDA